MYAMSIHLDLQRCYICFQLLRGTLTLLQLTTVMTSPYDIILPEDTVALVNAIIADIRDDFPGINLRDQLCLFNSQPSFSNHVRLVMTIYRELRRQLILMSINGLR